jgi:hypothetical protein
MSEELQNNLERNTPAIRVTVESRARGVGSSRLAHVIAFLIAKIGYSDVQLVSSKSEFLPNERPDADEEIAAMGKQPIQIVEMVIFDGGHHAPRQVYSHQVGPISPLMQETDLRVRTLFDAIKHGDEDHQAWLRAAIDAHFAGKPKPEYVAGKSSKDKPAADVEHHPV